jgi:hypothetical protein
MNERTNEEIEFEGDSEWGPSGPARQRQEPEA